MPVLRVADYATASRSVFTTGEMVMIIIVIVAYTGILIFAGFKV